jgi:tetratricopeptide (TPR) repeat protein/CHAT domain-containing protein
MLVSGLGGEVHVFGIDSEGTGKARVFMLSKQTALSTAFSLALLLAAGPLRTAEGVDKVSTASELTARVDSLRNTGKFAEAGEAARTLLDFRRSEGTSKSYQVEDAERLVASMDKILAMPPAAQREMARAYSLSAEARRCRVDGRFAEGAKAAQEALAIIRRHLGEENSDAAMVLDDLARLQNDQASRAEMETLFKQALEIRERVLGPEHPDVGASLNNLAEFYRDVGRNPEALKTYQRALAITEETLGPTHADAGAIRNNMAMVLDVLSRYDEAEAMYKKALEIREHALGPDHPDVAATCDNLGILYHRADRYAEAETMYLRGLQIRQNALRIDHPDIARSCNNLGALYRNQARYAEAEQMLRRALAIQDTKNRDNPDLGLTLTNLGGLCRELGRYAEAEEMYQQALQIGEERLDPDNPRLVTAINNLGVLYRVQGRYAEAEALFKRALAMREKNLGPEHRDVGVTLSNLARLDASLGRPAVAEQRYRRAIAIFEKKPGPTSKEVAASLNNLGRLLADQGRYAEAESLLVRSLNIRTSIQGTNSVLVAQSLDGLGRLYMNEGRANESAQMLRRAIAVCDTVGPELPEMAQSLSDLAAFYRTQGDLARALSNSISSWKVWSSDFIRNGTALAEADALEYASRIRGCVDQCLSIYNDIAGPSDEMTREVANVVLASKGLVSDEIYARRKPVIDGKDPMTMSLWQSIIAVQKQQSRLFVEGPGKDASRYATRVDSLEAVEKDLEMKLARRNPRYGTRRDAQAVTVDRIKSLLPSRSILVEYAEFNYSGPEARATIQPRYLALLVGAAGTEIVELGPAMQIEKAVQTYRDHFAQIAAEHRLVPSQDQQARYDEIASKIYRAVWKPIEHLVSEAQIIMIAPDGALNMVSFVGLREGEDDAYLIEGHALHYLSAGRDLIRYAHKGALGNGLIAMGMPDFGATVEARTLALDSTQVAFRGRATPACRDLASLSWEPLPETGSEVVGVIGSWKKKSKESAIECIGVNASEERFKRDAPGRRVIHLATHGYYLQGACNTPGTQTGSGFEDLRAPSENPLLLSGLVFAGANLHGKGGRRKGAEDGIATAYEIAAMNLEGTRTVALSACESGLGNVQEGEGVYGLRRAFLMAGARTVISTLWPVSDRMTASLMARIYDDGDQPLYQRMRKLQLERIKELRRKRLPDHPATWGAFIVVGTPE